MTDLVARHDTSLSHLLRLANFGVDALAKGSMWIDVIILCFRLFPMMVFYGLWICPPQEVPFFPPSSVLIKFISILQ